MYSPPAFSSTNLPTTTATTSTIGANAPATTEAAKPLVSTAAPSPGGAAIPAPGPDGAPSEPVQDPDRLWTDPPPSGDGFTDGFTVHGPYSSGTCESNGYKTVTTPEQCLRAGRKITGDPEKGFRFDQPEGGYTDTGTDRVRGCTIHSGDFNNDLQFFTSAQGECGTEAFHCICIGAAPPPPSPVASQSKADDEGWEFTDQEMNEYVIAGAGGFLVGLTQLGVLFYWHRQKNKGEPQE